MLHKTTKLLLTTFLAIATVNTIEPFPITETPNSWLTLQTQAQAKSSGGRSGGGSFSRGSSGSRSSGRSSRGGSRSSSGSRSRGNSSTRSRSYNNSRDYSTPRTYYSSGGGYSSGGRGVGIFLGFLFFGIAGIVIFVIVSTVLKSVFSNNNQNNDGR